jgi:beta-phosphoglucomutase-like phosphatase (HAD superfamily)
MCAFSVALANLMSTKKIDRRFGAVLLDCDGTICETELITLAAFNEAFKERGLNICWSIDTYRSLLKVGASRQRIAHYFDSVLGGNWPGFENTNSIISSEAKERISKELQNDKNRCFQKVRV